MMAGKNNPGPRRLPGILPALLAEPFAASCKQNQGQDPALCFAYAVTVTTWVATNSPSPVFTVIVAVPAVAPDGADTVTVLPVMATVARAGTDELAVNSLLSASSGAIFTANVVLEPAAIELVVGARLTPVTRMSPSASVIWKV